MEIYEAKCSYKQAADSVLTFNVGDKFYVLGRPNDTWWFVKRIVDNLFGYVPAAYLQPATDKVIGRLVPNQRRGSREHNIHLQALAEIHRKVKPLPAHVKEPGLGMEAKPRTTSAKSPRSGGSVLSSRKMITIEDERDLPDHLRNLPSPPLLSPPPPDYDLDDDAVTSNGKPYHHQMNTSGHQDGERIPIPDEDEDVHHQIKPKPLINPVVQSKGMMNLHRELKQSGRKVLDKPELSKVFRDRQLAGKKKEAEKWQESKRTSMEIKLMERQEILQKEESRQQMAKEGIVEEDALKPEFAKLKLRQTKT